MFETKRFFKAVKRGDTDKIRAMHKKDSWLLRTREDTYSQVRPIYHALKSGNEKVIDCLLELGVTPESPAYYTDNVFFCAASHGRLKYVRQFLEANPLLLDQPSREGYTPMLIAAAHGHADVVEYLLSCGADPDHRNEEGHTGYYYAARENYPDVVALLRPLHAKTLESQKQRLKPREIQGAEAWKKLSDTRIAHIVNDADIGYRLTEIFNFKTAECTRLYQNTDTKAETSTITRFDELATAETLREAHEKLVELGGTVEPPVLKISHIGKKPLAGGG